MLHLPVFLALGEYSNIFEGSSFILRWSLWNTLSLTYLELVHSLYYINIACSFSIMIRSTLHSFAQTMSFLTNRFWNSKNRSQFHRNRNSYELFQFILNPFRINTDIYEWKPFITCLHQIIEIIKDESIR